MTRSAAIFFCLAGVAIWSLFAYYSFVVRDGSHTLLEALLAPSSIGPLVLLPLCLVQLWKLLRAERKENVLDPHFAFAASQSLLLRIGGAVVCAGIGTIGALRLWRSDVLPGDPVPLQANLIFFGTGAFGALVAMTTPVMRLKLSPDGLEYSMLRPPFVSWNDVADVKIRRLLMSTWVELTLKDTSEYRSAGPLGRWKKATKVQITPFAFGLEPDVLYRGIEARRNVFTF